MTFEHVAVALEPKKYAGHLPQYEVFEVIKFGDGERVSLGRYERADFSGFFAVPHPSGAKIDRDYFLPYDAVTIED